MNQVLQKLSLYIPASMPFALGRTSTSTLAMRMGLVLYAVLAARSVPHSVAALVSHTAVKMVVMVLIVAVAGRGDLLTALLLAIGLVITLNGTHQMVHELAVDGMEGIRGLVHTTVKHIDPAIAMGNEEVHHPVDLWSSEDGKNHLSMRGFDYDSDDEKNLLPGGHGDMETNGPFVDAALGGLNAFN